MFSASDLYTKDYLHLSPNATLREAINGFLTYKTDIACILDHQENLIGIVTKYSIYREILKNSPLNTPVKNFCKKEVVTVNLDDDLELGREKLLNANVSHAVVVNKTGKVKGVISKSDLIRGFFWEREILLKRMTTIINSLPLGIIVTDPGFKIIHINSFLQKYLKINENPANRFLIEVLPELKPLLLNSTLPLSLEQQKITLRNINFFLSIIPIKENTKIDSYLIMIQEASSLEKVAPELKTTQSLAQILQTVIETAYDSLIVVNLQEKIIFHSKNLKELILEESQENFSGVKLGKIIPAFSSKKLALLPDNYNEVLKINQTYCLAEVHKVKVNDEIFGYVIKLTYKQINHLKNLLERLDRYEHLYSQKNYSSNLPLNSKSLSQIITRNEKMLNIKNDLPLIAKTNATVLILGESGTGKELIASAIHELSGRRGNLVKINCAAIPEDLLESELFGYEEGAFTGARKGGKIGKFEFANNGTVFLDEIGDMPLTLQAKLLRVLEEKHFERIGSNQTIAVDLRFIAATNKDLKKLMHEGKFREDLYYRLNVIKIEIPPLRERKEDIPILAEYFLKILETKYNKVAPKISDQILNLLIDYSWPGNIRELLNVLERAVISCQREFFTEDNFNFLQDVNLQKGEDEKHLILKLLQEFKGNKSKVAKHLNISRVALYHKLKKYQIFEDKKYI